MDMLMSRPNHAMPFLDHPKYAQQSHASHHPAASARYLGPSAARSQHPPLRPSPASGHSYYALDQAPSQWANAYHPIITNFAYPSASENGEHSLRRKTPNGTIDNGYDGTPTQLACGPPSAKYPTLTPPGAMFLDSGRHSQTPNTMHWYYTQSPRDSCADGGNALMRGGGGFNQGSMGYNPAAYVPSLPSPSINANPMSYEFAMRNGYPSNYQNQPHPNSSLHSPAGYNSATPVWVDGPPAAYHDAMQLSTVLPPHNTPHESGFVPAQAPLPQWVSGAHGWPGQYPPLPMPHMLNDGFPRDFSAMHQPSQHVQSLALGAGPLSAANGLSQRLGNTKNFRENVLENAHKAYTELLTAISLTKKISHGKTNSRSTKNLIFPKGPKSLVARPTSHLQRAHQSIPGAVSPYHPRQDSVTMNNPHVMSRIIRGDSGMLPSAQLDATGRALRGLPIVPGTVSGTVLARIDPKQNAKRWLDMLENLCKPDWQWLDGMLMGGCLLHSLGRYEDALLWFQQIIGLERRHVEALSNIGATYYCLEQYTQAENSWKEAISIRPDYLEAVEFLVGLLCNFKRSDEAVEIIESVQQSLRLRPDEAYPAHRVKKGIGTNLSLTGAVNPDEVLAAQTDLKLALSTGMHDEFGSSGYRLPASENGKILGLVHNKGNMLYTLKLIEQASEAFEEAVLISAGREFGCTQDLIRKIQMVLSPNARGQQDMDQAALAAPLLLRPDEAKQTRFKVFSRTHGELPGLRHVTTHGALSTTSNSLLSLAKIFQDSMSSGGSSSGPRARPSGVGDILALYYLSLSLQESPSTANNVGILLASVQQTSTQSTSVLPTYQHPNRHPGIILGSGLDLALAYYKYGLTLDRNHVHLHTNLGSLLKDIGQLDNAIEMYRKAVECDGTFDIALTNLANAVKDRGRIEEAIQYYRRAADANPEFAEAVCGLSTALNSVCDWKGRGGVYLNGGRFDRWHVDNDGQLVDAQHDEQGRGLMKKVVNIVARQLNEASNWGTGIINANTLPLMVSQLMAAGASVTNPTLNLESVLRQWAGRPWEGSKIIRLIERSTRATMREWYLNNHVRQIEQPASPQQKYPRVRPPSNLTVPSAPTVLPFHTFTCPLTAKDVRRISQRNALRISCSTLRSPWLLKSVYPPPKPPSPCLNIGYVSSDFNNHPLAHLMQSVFGFHDQSRAKAFCYATTASDQSVHRQQIEREAPVFRDVSNWPSERLVAQIVNDGIHILVNLNGYTRGARNEIFAARPAPIQMSFMGFAGTLGAEWCDYLLADATAIPPSTLRPHRSNLSLTDISRDDAEGDAEDWVYSENIVFCRDTFFCCDHRQSADEAERGVTWEEEQRRRWKMRKEIFPDLRDDAIILGNFNQLYKIDPTTFRTWLRILDQTPKAILWLLKFPELGERALRETAAKWATEEVCKRIYFTDVAPKQQHIARARVCDLFLDTPECNAHTTAADVLWSSTPLLTLPRYDYKMCSRMAASILKGALPKGPAGEQAALDLIADDDDAYEFMAVKLANGMSYHKADEGYGQAKGRLWDLRKLLFDAKWHCALFDTRRWVSDLEEAYEEAWRRWVAGVEGDIYL
ncbi:unnamed protein product [Discula destructiva]